MAIYKVETFDEIISCIVELGKFDSTDTAVLNKIRRIVNTRYQQISYKKKWQWRTRQRDQRLKGRHDTGTLIFTTNTRLVVAGATAPALTADMVGASILKTGDREIYEVVDVDVALQTLKLSTIYQGTTSGAAGEGYNLFHYKYGLFPDFDEVVDIWHDYYRRKIEPLSPRAFNEHVNKFTTNTGKALYYTIDGTQNYDGVPMGEFVMGYDYMGVPSSKQIKFFPMIADEDYFAHIKFTFNVQPMEHGTDEPIIPVDNRMIIPYITLADLFIRETDGQSAQYWMGQARDELSSMMGEFDAHNDYPRLIGARRPMRKTYGLPIELGDLFDIYG